MRDLRFRPPGPVSRAFMLSPAFVRGIRGPVGSAKSSTCTMEMVRLMTTARPNDRGWRMTRNAIIRNTNPMLKTTTVKTWEDWLDPEVFGEVKMAPPPYEQEIDIDLGDGTRLIAENYFLALDRPEDMRKLLSLELTFAWINEAREVPKTLVDGVTQRLRRYPSQRNGGFERSCLIMDTNSPDADHWWPIMAGDVPPPEGMTEQDIAQLIKPQDWAFFTQPPAMNEIYEGAGKARRLIGYETNHLAENIQNLDANYYPGMLPGKSKAFIDVYILNKIGATHDGRPVHGNFNRQVHVAGDEIHPLPGIPFVLGLDFGLTPAAVFMQPVRGRWLVFDEIVLTDASAKDLAAAVNRRMATHYPGHKIGVAWGDPAGDQRAGTDKRTPFQMMRAAKIPARAVETNDPAIRREALNAPLTRMVGGEPAILFCPVKCPTVIAGYEGGWFRKRIRGAGEMFEDEPIKNRYSHPCEAGEYALLGGGEAREAMGRKKSGEGKAVNIRSQADPLQRFSEARRNGRRGAGPLSR